jgi:hypothetical protein
VRCIVVVCRLREVKPHIEHDLLALQVVQEHHVQVDVEPL